MTPLRVQSLRGKYQSALQGFISSPESFQILGSVPALPSGSARSGKVLYVLDSSFNPPTKAHLFMATSALQQHHSAVPVRLLLLLATQNADKPSKPAWFEDRLAMMDLLAEDLRSHLRPLGSGPAKHGEELAIDIGVTKQPYFMDKAAAIEASGAYSDSPEQVHLTGYDTLIRIFNPKYYPPEHSLQTLAPFLSRHRLRVTLRPDDDWGGSEEQHAYLRTLAQGGREAEGGKREWAQQIELVEGTNKGEEVVSSTKARQAAKGDLSALDKLVTPSVREYVAACELYKET